MALTEERLRSSDPQIRTPEPAELEAMLGTEPRPRLGSKPRGLVFAWIGTMSFLFLFEPPPDNPSIPLWAALVSMGFLAAVSATLYGLGSKRGWALRASGMTAGAGMALAAACAQTGHHAGLWWAVELAAFTALMAATAAARRGNSSGQERLVV
jgi:hypothetical protein